jgi:hypothetical protein
MLPAPTLEELYLLARTRVKEGEGRVSVSKYIESLKIPNAFPDTEEWRHNENCARVSDLLIQSIIKRNEQARQLEREGQVDEAIRLYEMSVTDLFWGSFPYDRLRILYTRLKRYDDAIRVLKVYIKNPYLSKPNRRSLPTYREWVKKIQAKKKKQK